jgi:glucosamine--fructose-6-phosphate aminotransferase (isomerizing)
MCGIFGVVAQRQVENLLLEGLNRLEYRGYDSAGIATLDKGKIHFSKAKGKIKNLEKKLDHESLKGKIGIAHTRWATHGEPEEINAHPHITDNVAVVHNGIIENFRLLREELEVVGHKFKSDTDTEVIPFLIDDFLKQGLKPLEAVKETLKKLKGAFALGIIFKEYDDLLIATRRGSPLAIGYGKGEMYMGSDAYVLSPLTSKVTYLEDDDIAVLHHDAVTIYDKKLKEVRRKIQTSNISAESAGKGHYEHFMLKEMHEQPTILANILNSYYDRIRNIIVFPKVKCDFKQLRKINIIACGTSYYAALIAKYWFESTAQIPVEVDIASEFKYRQNDCAIGELAICISQSGETADTIAALKKAKKAGAKILSIVNVVESSMARESDYVINILAGPEIGVASTKAFTAQLAVMALLAIKAGKEKDIVSDNKQILLCRALRSLPAKISEVLKGSEEISKLAKKFTKVNGFLYLGRGVSYGVALEGALKVKELSYVHAEGVAAGELKHGPIALIDKKLPVLFIAPPDNMFGKTLSNAQEVAARGGNIIAISDEEGVAKLADVAKSKITLPKIDNFASPLLYAVPVQLFAYYVAVHKGTDVDQPRNLAKSVTVE